MIVVYDCNNHLRDCNNDFSINNCDFRVALTKKSEHDIQVGERISFTLFNPLDIDEKEDSSLLLNIRFYDSFPDYLLSVFIPSGKYNCSMFRTPTPETISSMEHDYDIREYFIADIDDNYLIDSLVNQFSALKKICFSEKLEGQQN